MRAKLIEDPTRWRGSNGALIERIGVANAKATKIGLEVIGPTRCRRRSRSAARSQADAQWFGSRLARPRDFLPPERVG
jgi:hypothetical protein